LYSLIYIKFLLKASPHYLLCLLFMKVKTNQVMRVFFSSSY